MPAAGRTMGDRRRKREMNDFTSPIVLAMNLIRYIGDEVSKSGGPVNRLQRVSHAIGVEDYKLISELDHDLKQKNLIRGNLFYYPDGVELEDANLSLDGWERYEREKRGSFSGDYGFLAMQFGDPNLEEFVEEVVKPTVKESGYKLMHMRDVGRAGIIDNIMRMQIRDSAFVISDLTHDNLGAYWEAGYAEGLGKPVIYICEKNKFRGSGTHFDTNHSTTVLWSMSEREDFRRELIATIRRSLEDRADQD